MLAIAPKDISDREKAPSQADEDIPVQSSPQSGKTLPDPPEPIQRTKTPPPTLAQSASIRPQPSPYTQQLVTSLVDLQRTGAPTTPEQVAVWKQNLQQLIQQGSAALPAIEQFLQKNEDFVFGTDTVGTLGYASARRAMFDALAQIGGPEAIGALASTLQTTTDPREIALLARSLDQLAPEQYRQQAIEASRQILAMATDGKLDQTVDLAPVFGVLGQWSVAGAGQAALEQASGTWKYYSALSLGEMQDGAGIPSLIHLVDDNSGGPVKNIAALEVLAQNALQFPDARAALLRQVQANGISPGIWAYLAPVLSGDQVQFMDTSSGTPPLPANTPDLKTYHIASGNQNFYTAPPAGGFSPEQISRQMALIDELLAATSEPAAIQTLQSSSKC